MDRDIERSVDAPYGWKTIGWLADGGKTFLSGPGQVWIAPLATPGEIECCEQCMTYARRRGRFADELGHMRQLHANHSGLTKGPDKRTIDPAIPTTTTEEKSP